VAGPEQVRFAAELIAVGVSDWEAAAVPGIADAGASGRAATNCTFIQDSATTSGSSLEDKSM
jgi:hypothetical protein